ncbi:MAG: M48 family metalloprotease [Acidobacteriota bacterium]|nr:M48 family metalloprotease [Acidobacteriota bacterium]
MMRSVMFGMALACSSVGLAEARSNEPGPSRAVAEGEGGVSGQLGQITKGVQVAKKANEVRDLSMTDAEEAELGANVSERIRTRYGVVQDAAVHHYLALIGTALAQGSTRPALPWTFIVLDTDGVNAFAAPGGYVHITRGALALIKNEAELAGVLGHEIIHITEKHTIRAIQKSKAVQMGAAETLSGSSGLMERAVTATYDNIVERGFGRAEENESDEMGVTLANKIGYAPNGLNGFLTTLKDRNKASTEKRGLFASHPEMQERLDRITKLIASKKLTATATVQPRYAKNITYKPVAVTAIATVDPGAAGLAGGDTKAEEAKAAEKKEAEEPKKKGFGLSRMLPTGGGEKKSAQVTASGGARGVDPEKDSKGGSNPKVVPVKLVAADLAAFKKDGGLP